MKAPKLLSTAAAAHCSKLGFFHSDQRVRHSRTVFFHLIVLPIAHTHAHTHIAVQISQHSSVLRLSVYIISSSGDPNCCPLATCARGAAMSQLHCPSLSLSFDTISIPSHHFTSFVVETLFAFNQTESGRRRVSTLTQQRHPTNQTPT